MAASLLRPSRLGPGIGALGALYIFRDDIKSLVMPRNITSPQQSNDSLKHPEKTVRIIEHLPTSIPYLLVGGGTASHAAMRAIRGHDPKAKVLIVTSEDHSPYMRPALSKELWFSEKELRKDLKFKFWSGKERSIFYELDEFYIPLEDLEERETGGVSLIRNIRLTKLDPEEKIAHLDNGQSIRYDKCLLAPGGKPKTTPVFDSAPQAVKDRIIYFRTAQDFLKLDAISDKAQSIVIVGGGFLGSELACALSRRPVGDKALDNQKIFQIFPESGNLGKILPRYLSEWLTSRVQKEGAKVIPNSEVVSVDMGKKSTLQITLSNGVCLEADYIVCAIGLEPDVELAKSSNLEVDEHTGGYLVNSELEARSNVWVAGDASCFYDIMLGRRRVEHHDHAINSGRQAGRNMIGDGKAYTHQPMFWSDLGPDLSFEAVGLVDSSLETVAVFTKEPLPLEGDTRENEQPKSETPTEAARDDEADRYSRGIIFYLKDGIIVGVLLWNLFNRLNIARRILNEQKKYDDLNEVAKLFNVYLED